MARKQRESYMKKRAIIYCRVSTSKQAQEGESLELQERICRQVASDKLNAEVMKVWSDSFSGRKVERPAIDEIFEFIEKHKGQIHYFIFRDIDRVTRAGSSEYWIIKKLMTSHNIEMVDSFGLIQPVSNTLEHLGFEYSWSKFSTSDLTETLKADISKDEVRTILTRLIGAEISLVQDGYQIGSANEGFVNQKILVGNKKKTIQVRDTNKAHFFEKIFQMRASGQYTDTEIVNEINAMGFKTRVQKKWNKNHTEVIGKQGGELLTVKRLQRYIQRPIYCGIVCRKWTNYQAVKAQFEGLVSVDLFNKANKGKVFVKETSGGEFQILYNQKLEKEKRVIRKYNLDYPYKNVILCDQCQKPFMASAPKGKSGNKFPTYHCGGKKRGHSYYGVPKNEFEEHVEKCIKELKMSDLFHTGFDIVLKEVWKERSNETEDTGEKINRNISDLRAKQNQILDTLLSTNSETTKRALEQRIDVIEKDIELAETQKIEMKTTEQDIDRFARYAQYLVEHVEELLLDKQNLKRQEALFGLVFEEFPTYQEIVARTPKTSLVLQIKETSHEEKSQLVTPVGIEPTTIGLKGHCSTG